MSVCMRVCAAVRACVRCPTAVRHEKTAVRTQNFEIICDLALFFLFLLRKKIEVREKFVRKR